MRQVATAALIAAILGASGAVLMGYALGHSEGFHLFGTPTPMALLTAMLFFLCGIVMLLDRWDR